MTAPNLPNPDDFLPEWLAAYADGELDGETRAAVSRWLREHPETAGELLDQQELGPANAGLWERAEPPEPSESQWAVVRRGIDAGLNPPVPVTRGWKPAAWTVGGLVAAVAAAVAWVAFGPVTQPPQNQIPPVDVAKRLPAGPEAAPAPREVSAVEPDPLAGLAVLPIADDADVILDRVPDTRTGWLPVGLHPLPDVLVLATLEEVELQEVDPSPAWPPGGPKMVTAPGDAPMIFAAKPR